MYAKNIQQLLLCPISLKVQPSLSLSLASMKVPQVN
jgi:hypothetical protein